MAWSIVGLINLDRQLRLARNAQRLVDRFEEFVAFAADMRDIHAAVLGRDLAQLDEFFCGGIRRGRVDQRRGDAHRAFFHRFGHEGLHRLELRRRRRDVVPAEHVDSNGRRRDERADVGRHTALLQVIEILAERSPRNLIR
jgi:hypothetical protein